MVAKSHKLMSIRSTLSGARLGRGRLTRSTSSFWTLLDSTVVRELTQGSRQFVCRIKGHKLKTIVKDMVFVCERCEATYLRKDIAKRGGGQI
jgi:hypothetical protein